MRNVGGKTYYQIIGDLSSKGLKSLFIIALLWLASGCSQSVDNVSIERRLILPEQYITTTDIQGGTSSVPASASRRLGIHSLGGSNLRMSSTSANYRLTGGIGVD